MKNLVSIITPVYNSEAFLRDCIESVLSQTYSNWEHLLVDDGSRDQGASILSDYALRDSRIKFIKLEENLGAGMARNKALEVATGRYMAFLDSDDVWHPEKLVRQLAFMKENNYPFTFTSYSTMDCKAKKMKRIQAKRVVTYRQALYKNPIGCLTVVYDVDFFGKQRMPAIRRRQDYGLWLQLLKKTNAHGLDEDLASYRIHPDSVSFNKWKLLKHEWKLYREVEKLSLLKSTFYLVSAVFLKLKSYF